MKCRSCKKEIPDGSAFCNFCGKPVRTRRNTRTKMTVPKPRQLASGDWAAQVMHNGQRYFVVGASVEEYRDKALAVKLGLSEDGVRVRTTLRYIINDYIDSVSSTLSPATIRGYRNIVKCRFQAYMDKPVSDVDFQRMINAEARIVSSKTVLNAWGLVTASLNAAGIEIPNVKRPQLVRTDEDFLDYIEIKKFLAAIKDKPIEVAALLALHGLRTSEFLDLDVCQITQNGIFIRGATVPDENHKFVHKATNKNSTSRRDVPILIPRLLDVLPDDGKAVVLHPSSIRRGIEKACIDAGVTVCSPHDLRRSFVSLAFHLGWDAETTRRVGGWSNLEVVNKVYRKLADEDLKRDVLTMQKYYLDA